MPKHKSQLTEKVSTGFKVGAEGLEMLGLELPGALERGSQGTPSKSHQTSLGR